MDIPRHFPDNTPREKSDPTEGGREGRGQMLLGWYDRRDGNRRVRYLDKRGTHASTSPTEDTTAYAVRFFREMQGVGNVEIVKIDGNKLRTIARRGI